MEATIAGGGAFDLAEKERTLEHLVEAYGDGVLQLAYFYVKDRSLAEDIFQEVFTKVFFGLHTFRGQSSPKTWIYRIAINLCHDKLRSWSMRRVLLIGEDFFSNLPLLPTEVDAVERVLAEADRQVLLETVMALPVEYREVITLYYYEEMDTREVAQALGLSEGTVRSRLHRARARLKALLLNGGYSHE
ncbi:MAG: polymerase subunit sigma [Symbiobacteriaceae bacterium]|jgi:RNA polymerase sigma-70 factor (ECF subfamily)|nr:polymerase subunit sigma [Symbiobacteriaceae bacterium]